MPITVTTIENETVLTGSGTATDVFVPSKAEIGRYRIRVARATFVGCTSGDNCTITGITPKPDGTGTETQTIAILLCQGSGVAPAVIAAATDTISFPDECELRGRIQAAMTITGGTCTVFLHHG